MILARLSYWRHCVILKHEQGKLRKQHSKPMLIRSMLSCSFSDRRHSSLLISSGSNCCSLKISASSLRTKIKLCPVFFQLFYHGFQTKAGKSRRVRTRQESESTVNRSERLGDVQLLLQWGWVLPVQVCSLVGLWGGCFHLFKFLDYHCQSILVQLCIMFNGLCFSFRLFSCMGCVFHICI